jgi:hypothetical protein
MKLTLFSDVSLIKLYSYRHAIVKKKLFETSVFLLRQFVHAQDAFSSSDRKATGLGGSASYAVCQVFYSSSITTAGSVLQGVHQAFEIQTHRNP